MLTCGLATACGAGFPDNFDRQLSYLDAAYNAGVKTRATLVTHGMPATAKSCGQIFDNTKIGEVIGRNSFSGAVESDDFHAERRGFFVNGCLGRPKPTPSVPAQPKQ